MFTYHHNQDLDRWEAYWNGTLYGVASTEHDIHHYTGNWRQQ